MMADENDLPASGSEVIDSYGRKENLGGESEYSHTVRLAVRTPAGLPTAAGQKKALRAVLNGKRMTNQVEWKSSNNAVATVSNNGVVTGVAAGTANITASHPAGNTSTAQAVTIV